MEVSPIKYVKKAKLRGHLFDATDESGCVSSAWTNFPVDHREPLEVLAGVAGELAWPLGQLLEGHEFLLLLEANQGLERASRSDKTFKAQNPSEVG